MSISHRNDVQGLRAIAVLAVIVFHFNREWLPGGFVGVDIFFVISGFLITTILIREKGSPHYSLRIILNKFYFSRIQRIFPAYLFMLAIVMLVASWLFISQDFNSFVDSLKNAILFNSNSYFSAFGDYFAPATHEQPLLHTWSLAVEIKFYLMAPLFILFCPTSWLKWTLASLLIGLTICAEYQLRFLAIEQSTYYSLYARLPEFFAGSLTALYAIKSSEDRLPDWLGSLGLIIIIIAVIVQPALGGFPGAAALIPVVGCMLLLSQPAQGWVGRLLRRKSLVWIGALSYSLYLWHWPVLAFLRYYSGEEVLSINLSIVFISMTFFLSMLSYYFVEHRFRIPVAKDKHVLAWLLLIACVCMAAFSMFKINDQFTVNDMPLEYQRYADPETICHGQIVGECLRGDLSSDKEVLVLGDSHAAMLNNFFDYLGKRIGFKARIITASSCMTIPSFDYPRIPEWAQENCRNQIKFAKTLISKNKVIFIGAMWSYHFSFPSFEKSLSEFISEYEKGHSIYFLPQIPLLDNNIERLNRFNRLGFNKTPIIDNNYVVANELLNNIVSLYPKVSIVNAKIDVSSWLTFSSLNYSDKSHLNEVGSYEYAKMYFNPIATIFKKKEMETEPELNVKTIKNI
ncbi:acyltransferase family protein [Aeromonas veronii]|uniref:acyltransferase family protein n=1 Tax=Aeromonas veronii TaxID=654 RepID=UPI002B46113B|nr:acyltransferase family protein [Aeromonas veronii]